MNRFFIVVLLCFSSAGWANTYNNSLYELFELTGVKEHYINLNNILINQMQVGYFQAADQTIDATSFTEDQKKQVGEILKTRFTKMVENYQTYVTQSMSYEKVTREVYIPLYKEFYSEREVNELLAFYKSPLGKKTIDVSQQITNQVAKRSADRYDAMIVEFIEKQVRENIELAKKEIASQIGP